MTTLDPTIRRRETFTKQVVVARKCAPGGYLTPVDIKGLTKRGTSYGLERSVINEIIAVSAETWRDALSVSNLGVAARR